ncbi:MAG: ferric reductase-like transmembrane domain-containing protein, partial [Formosimonas sp.]
MNTTTVLTDLNPIHNRKSQLMRHGLVFLLVLMLSFSAGIWLFDAVPSLSTLPALMAQSFGTEQAKGFWWVSRASGVVAYLLFWLSMMLGLLMTNKLLRELVGASTLLAVHEFSSILGWFVALFHALILMGDSYLNFGWTQVLIPWASSAPQASFIAMGQIAFYAMAMILLSFYVRKRIGFSAWRWLHFATFVSYMLITVHGLLVGSDAMTPLMLWVYGLSNGAVLFLTVYRLLSMNNVYEKAK